MKRNWSDEILNRKDRIKGADALLKTFEEDDEIEAKIIEAIKAKRKPVTVLSAPLLAALGPQGISDDLRRYSGRVMAYFVEHVMPPGVAVRSKGSKVIRGDAVFRNGQNFVLAPPRSITRETTARKIALLAALIGADDLLDLITQLQNALHELQHGAPA